MKTKVLFTGLFLMLLACNLSDDSQSFNSVFTASQRMLLSDNSTGDSQLYVFLCLGQSNMEGVAKIESQDKHPDSRFKIMAGVDCQDLGRQKGKWYTAVPPLCRCSTGLSPADYFGKKMIERLPENIKVGLVVVAIKGVGIELFDNDKVADYIVHNANDEMLNAIDDYGGDVYGRLVELAKIAKQSGKIKGILLHQGESNNGDREWPNKVNTVYNNLLKDLNLTPEETPLLAGELVHAEERGLMSDMNTIIDSLPLTIPTAYIIDSRGCPAATDRIHFSSEGCRKLGEKYADKMLELLGYN
ncbi:MAG: sialate O-acetylesterase [Tannerella sp.]|nr:sialate O-acetylesterase [Tannerella sp.]